MLAGKIKYGFIHAKNDRCGIDEFLPQAGGHTSGKVITPSNRKGTFFFFVVFFFPLAFSIVFTLGMDTGKFSVSTAS